MRNPYEEDREDSAVFYDCLRPDEEMPEPIEDALGQDPMQLALADAFRMQERLRATNDSRAIAASNRQSQALFEALKGHL